MAAIDLIAEEPIRFVKERITHCDGGKFGVDCRLRNCVLRVIAV